MRTVTAGALEVRLADNDAEREAAQALRYRVFYDEMAARPSEETAALKRDFDAFDPFCDHLLVIDRERGAGTAGVIGTYRLLRRTRARQAGGYYSSAEFDVSCLDSRPGEPLELGRSCVDVAFRTRSTMQLLWRGIAQYVFHHKIEVMFGCASLQGTDLEPLQVPLSYLYHHHLAPPELRPSAWPALHIDMRFQAPGRIDAKAALTALPPLIKGYLRLGGFVGDGAVIDPQFNTTDICIVVKTDLVTQKYYRHYERETRHGVQSRGPRSA